MFDFSKVIEMDYGKASEFFTKYDEICKADEGKLWGVSLRVPFVFIDTATRQCAANEPDCEGILTKHSEHNIYTGIFPEHLVVSASVTEFGGKRWAMMPWNAAIMFGEEQCLKTMAHEAVHCLQPEIVGKVQALKIDNIHMDALDARVSFVFEIGTLLKALKTADGDERKAAINAALCARSRRREQYNKAYDENCFEISEGMANYAEVKAYAHSKDEIISHTDGFRDA